MKKFMWVAAAVVLVTAFAGMFLKNQEKDDVYTKELFMFDTICTVTAYGDGAEEAVEATVERLGEIHSATDFFSEKSEVSRINSAKSGEGIQVGEDMAKILAAAKKISEDSDGFFDITVASVSQLWEFSKEGRVPSDTEIKATLNFVGTDKIIFDEEKMVVTKTADEVKIDLGGAAKGYAGDVAVQMLKSKGLSGGIVDLGGNITCFGKNPNTKDGKWRIGLQKPFEPTGEYDKVLEISEGAVVTSGTYQRYFEKGGQQYHHILDPQTGYPSMQNYSSVTVVTESGIYGDSLATACFVLGEERGKALAEKYGAEIYFR